MLISLSGTPGTGKSTVSEILRRKGYEVIDLNRLAIEKGLISGYDRKRKCHIIDEEKLSSYVESTFQGEEKVVILEGHLSHLVRKIDMVIVLRCRPSELEKRLKKKGWKGKKVRENMEAEALDVILCEAVDMHHDKVAEIDTTHRSPSEVAKDVEKLMIEGITREYKPGKISWLEEMFG